jgi:p-methyltransferase
MDYYRAQLWYNEPGTPIHDLSEKYGIQGEGFVWSHATMDSLEAMEHIERLFLTLDGPTWLPQWSFDFWILPYFEGKGIKLPQLREQMRLAHKALALEVADLSREEHDGLQAGILAEMVRNARSWNPVGARG